MSKVKDLPELVSAAPDDVLYAVDDSAGPNAGRKIKISTIKTATELTASEVKTKYESNPDTNAFTDAEKTKLSGIETGATADQIAIEVPYDNTASGLSATEVQSAIDELSAEADFRPSVVSGRILHYTGGTARFDDVFFDLVGNDILLNSNITDGTVYVDLDGIVKQTASSTNPPPYTIVIAKFTTDLNNIVSLVDQRVKNSQNIVRGTLADVRDVRAGASASEGNSGRVSDAMHKHNILTAAPSTIGLNQPNAEGTSVSLPRADHTHLLESDIAVDISDANGAGSGNKVAASNHTHKGIRSLKANSGTERFGNTSLKDGNGVSVTDDGLGNFTIDTTIGPNELRVTQGAGLTANYTAGKVRINGTVYTIAASSFSVAANATNGRIYVDVDGVVKSTTSTTSPPNSISLAVYSSNVSSITALTDNRTLLNNNLVFGSSGDIGALAANGAAAAGATNKYADAGHKHLAPTAAAVSISTTSTNTAGATGNFADAGHTHAVSVASQEATATAGDTTTSVTDTLMGSMTATPAAGTYLVMWSGSTVNSTNGAERTWVSLYLNGVQVTATERSAGTAGGAWSAMSTQAIITTPGSQAIELRWRVAAGTSTVRSRRLILLRIG